MSNPQFKPWSDNPNAPKISHVQYIYEKVDFFGYLTAPILYGMIIVLFFKCMTALLDPTYRRGERIKWGLMSYTVVMFSLATVLTAMNLDIESIAHIDNRNFSRVEAYTGPYGYLLSIYPKAINVAPNAAFLLNNWLADGFLLYRCYVIYSRNPWVIAFPCFMFLGSVAMGILMIPTFREGKLWISIPYFSISLSLNVTLTLMIVVRLVLHGRNVRAATGSRSGIGRLHKTIASILIESCALFTLGSLLVIGTYAANNPAVIGFVPLLGETQVIAPLLIIQRVADKSALTSDTIVSGRTSSFKARSRGELTSGSGTLPDEYSMGPVGEHGTNSGEHEIGVETRTDFHQDMV